MAVKVSKRYVPAMTKEPAHKLVFYLPVHDQAVMKMIQQRGHRISSVLDEDWHIALFTGGLDVLPALYGERLMPQTRISMARDLDEVTFYKMLHHQRYKVGICRGAQFLNVMSGGRLWQHVEGHAIGTKKHLIKIWGTDETAEVTSRHHQMMIPGSDAWTIADACCATKKESPFEVINTPKGWNDPEIIYYHSTNSLCFQPHPEDDLNGDTYRLFWEWVEGTYSPDKHKNCINSNWTGEVE